MQLCVGFGHFNLVCVMETFCFTLSPYTTQLYSILTLSGTLKGSKKSVTLSECPNEPNLLVSGTLTKMVKMSHLLRVFR